MSRSLCLCLLLCCMGSAAVPSDTLDCQQVTCANGGTCVGALPQPFCNCVSGFCGPRCVEQCWRPSCTGFECYNGGQCVLSNGEPTCACEYPYLNGTRCQNRVYGCESSPCANGATCGLAFNSGRVYCTCPSGWGGVFCDEAVWAYDWACGSSPCQNDGTCSPSTTSSYPFPRPLCKCPVGWIGSLCSYASCSENLCLNGGTCVPNAPTRSGSTSTCECTAGFAGYRCAYPVVNCSYSCQRAGNNCPTCSNVGSLQTVDSLNNICYCSCQYPGYTGTHCEHNVCASDPCQNGGTCNVQMSPSTPCQCPSGFGGPYCEHHVCDPSPCENGGSCYPSKTPPFYHCVCPVVPFQFNNNQCSNSPTSAHFNYVGLNCEYVSPCASSPCQNGGACMLTNPCSASFNWSCQCASPTSGALCGHTVDVCGTPMYETFQFQCGEFGTCVNDPSALGGFSCTCAAGYGGHYCTQFATCDSSPCLNGGSCQLYWGSGSPKFVCSCPFGFAGLFCESAMTPECDSSPCMNGGTCVTYNVVAARCSCPVVTTGTYCETLQPCASSPCMNGGVCSVVQATGVIACKCPSVFGGLHCETPVNCDPSSVGPCENGGTCAAYQSYEEPQCLCSPCFTGVRCEQLIPTVHDCTPAVCAIGGLCNTHISGLCTCNTFAVTSAVAPTPTTAAAGKGASGGGGNGGGASGLTKTTTIAIVAGVVGVVVIGVCVVIVVYLRSRPQPYAEIAMAPLIKETSDIYD